MAIVKLKLIGHYNYYGITDNSIGINKYYEIVKKQLYKWLNRESQRGSFTTWEFKNMIKTFKIPMPRITVNIYDI